MKFAKWLFTIAGWYGIVVLAPLYVLEARIGRDQPPAITHPEYFYGFAGCALACQLMFLIVGRDPLRFRSLMPVAIFEKAQFVVAVAVLWAQHRIPVPVIAGAAGDLLLGILFTFAYTTTASHVP